MNRSATVLRALAYGGAATAFVLSLWLLGASSGLKEMASPAAATAGTPSYYAALVDDHVVIYVTGRSDPVLVTEIDARTLPDADRKLLEDGLPLDNAADVNRLLEDYSG
ncbi:MAG: hypothetical protein ACI3XZ_00910 [Butyricicoccus sp.]